MGYRFVEQQATSPSANSIQEELNESINQTQREVNAGLSSPGQVNEQTRKWKWNLMKSNGMDCFRVRWAAPHNPAKDKQYGQLTSIEWLGPNPSHSIGMKQIKELLNSMNKTID